VTPLEVLLEKLPDAKRSGNGWLARCPAHDDKTPSLSVAEGDDGKALLKCHAGCTAQDIVSAVGLSVPDLFPERTDPAPGRNRKPRARAAAFPTADAAVAVLERRHGKASKRWTYHDTAGEPVGLVVRWDLPGGGKDIRPVSRHADGWRIAAMPDPRPLYRLPELAEAECIVVAEGEKSADAARSLGFTATTSAGGSQAAARTDWRPLAGKEVWVLPDSDAPGRKYADTVVGILERLSPPAVVKIIALPDLPGSGDVVDWIAAHGDAAEPGGMRSEIEALARAVEPEAPGPVANDAQRFRPFPVDALPEPIRGFVAAGAGAIGCDPSYLALPLLVALAAAVGNTRRLELKPGWSVPPILWGAIVGDSGTAKTPAFRLAVRPLRERQQKALDRHAEAVQRHEAELARWERDFADWKRNKGTTPPPRKPDAPRAERSVVSDTTVEALAPILKANPRGLLLARDELDGWLGSFDRYAARGKAGADAANWLSVFNAETITVDRKTGTPPTICVPRAAVCVVGGIQPGVLRRALGAEHRESGLAARLLFAYPPRRPKKWTEAGIDPRAEERLARLFDRLHELRPAEDGGARPVSVQLSTKAKAVWVEFYGAHAEEQADLTGDLAAAWSKLEEYAARLALVVHFVRWAAGDPTLAKPDVVDATSMQAGVTLAGWFKHEARRVYAMLGESGAERDHRRLVEWIGVRKGGSVTAREVRQGCRWLKEAGAAEAALDELVRAGRGVWQDAPSAANGGRPTRVFVLPTAPPVYETPTTDLARGGSVDVDTVDAAPAQPDAGETDFPFGWNNPDDPDGGRLFPDPPRGLPD
jgi:hypothetical protein